MIVHEALLHTDAYDRIPVLGAQYKDLMAQRVDEVAVATLNQRDPDVTVLMRTRNHRDRLEGLFTDLSQQQYTGDVQVVVVDTESTDGTVDVARSHGATIVPLHQKTFNYATSLNRGFEAADNPYVLTLVGHTRLASTFALNGLTRWHCTPDFAGAYGTALPDSNATSGDIVINLLQHTKERLAPAEVVRQWQPGAMVAHRSVVKKDAWKELGGYNQAFGNGGEDTDFARRMAAMGMAMVREPSLSVLHSYGLNPWNTLRQIKAMHALRHANPTQFDQAMLSYRPDLRPVLKIL